MNTGSLRTLAGMGLLLAMSCRAIAGGDPPRTAGAPPGQPDFKQAPEWKALGRYVGSWEQQATVAIPERKQWRESITASWILGGRFLQLRQKSEADNSEALFLYTFDPDRRTIRGWSFGSSGQTGITTGSWDEAASTLTLQVQEIAPQSCTITDRFVDDDHREWKLVFENGEGKVIFESSGKATRQKNAAYKPVPDPPKTAADIVLAGAVGIGAGRVAPHGGEASIAVGIAGSALALLHFAMGFFCQRRSDRGAKAP